MPYIPQTWSDNNPSFPASAARFAIMEAGIANATSLAEFAGARYANVKAAPYGAVGSGSVDDSGAINAAIVDVASLGGGIVYIPRGTYGIASPVILRSGVTLVGDGLSASVLRVLANANVTVLKTLDFDTLTTTNISAGPDRFAVYGLTIDGNKANNVTSGYGVQLYGRNFLFRDFEIMNCRQDGWYSEWFTGGDAMESLVTHFKILDCNGHGMRIGGPHDSNISEGQIIRCGQDGTSAGIYVGANVATNSGDATGVTFDNVHVWGGAVHGYRVTGRAVEFSNCTATDATAIQVWCDATDVTWIGGRIHGTGASDSSIGLRVGDTTTTTFPTRCVFSTTIGDSQTLVHFMREGGSNRFILNLRPVATGAPLLGVQHVTDMVDFLWENAALNTDASIVRRLQFPGDVAVSQVGSGLMVTEGANAKMGTATLVAGAATVATTKVTANSRIFLSGQNSSGTHGNLTVSARTAATSFNIASSSATDTRLVAWMIVEPF